MALQKKKNLKTLGFAGDILMTGICFAGLSYRAIPENMRFESDLGFCLLWLGSLLGGFFTTPRSKYNIRTILEILVIPFSVDYLMAYRGAYFMPVAVLCLLCFCAYTAAVLLVCYPDIRRGCCRKKRLRFVHHYLFRSRTVISAVLTAALLGFGVYGMIEARLSQAGYREHAVLPDRIAQAEVILETMGGKTDMVSSLCQDRWEAISPQERTAVLQQVADTECDYLGIPYRLSVSAAEMERNSVRGYYSPGSHKICLNSIMVETMSAQENLSTLLHEVYHAFEYAVVEVYEGTDASFQQLRLFESARSYSREFDNYISGAEDFDAYINQLVEQDSKFYSDLRLRDYADVIAYLNQVSHGTEKSPDAAPESEKTGIVCINKTADFS